MDRFRLKGDEGQQIWAGWAILAYNADTLAVRMKHSASSLDQSKPFTTNRSARHHSASVSLLNGSIRGK